MILLAILLIVTALVLAAVGLVFGDLIIAIAAIVFIVKAIKKRKGKGK